MNRHPDVVQVRVALKGLILLEYNVVIIGGVPFTLLLKLVVNNIKSLLGIRLM